MTADDISLVHNQALQEEKKLRELLRSTPSESAEAQALRDVIRQLHSSVIAKDPLFAARVDVEQSLWKSCYYKRIEDFRKRIRKYANAAVASGDALSREHLHRICQSFGRFLTDASAFYAGMLSSFETQLHFPERSTHQSLTSADCDRLSLSIHRCLIFMGDLARYRELHSESSTKDWSKAEAHYQKALEAMPHGGNPHNQMAVLATYTDAECVAVYRYCRSLLIAQPFMTARENLALLFEKNRQKMVEEAEFMAARGTAKTRTQHASAKAMAAAAAAGIPCMPSGKLTGLSQSRGPGGRGNTGVLLKSFLRRFVRLHGILFTAESDGMTEFGTMYAAVINDFRTLLYYSAFGDALLLKMVVICTFTVITAAQPRDISSPPSQAMDDSARATCLSWALALAYGIAAQIGGHVRTHNPQWVPPLSRSSSSTSEEALDASGSTATTAAGGGTTGVTGAATTGGINGAAGATGSSAGEGG
eukprot:8830-Heterococcus_DN1.PRE.1